MSGLGGWVRSRGSTRVTGPGYLILALGALVLIAGLGNPAPAEPRIDVAAVRSASSGSPRSSFPVWLGGGSLVGMVLAAAAARRALHLKELVTA